MAVARYIALPLISQYRSLHPANHDTLKTHFIIIYFTVDLFQIVSYNFCHFTFQQLDFHCSKYQWLLPLRMLTPIYLNLHGMAMWGQITPSQRKLVNCCILQTVACPIYSWISPESSEWIDFANPWKLKSYISVTRYSDYKTFNWKSVEIINKIKPQYPSPVPTALKTPQKLLFFHTAARV